MKLTRTIIALGLSALTLALTGCVVTSVYPFYSEKDLAFEPALVGVWKKTGQSDEHWKFERASGNGYRITSESGGKTTVLRGHVFKLHGQTFLDLCTTNWKEDIQPEPVPSHILAHIVQLTPTLKMSDLNYDWLKELLARNPKAVRHIVIQTGEKPEDRRIVLTADTAGLQQFVLKHLNTEAAWDTGAELQPDPARSQSH
jgi:hypothetical protein